MYYTINTANKKDILDLIHLRAILLDQGDEYYVAKTVEQKSCWKVAYQQWLADNLERENKVQILVARRKNTVIGCAIGIIDQRAPMVGCFNGLLGWIQTVVTIPACRGRGVAMNLVKALEQWFIECNVGKVTLQSTALAQPLYQKLGYCSSGEPLMIKALL